MEILGLVMLILGTLALAILAVVSFLFGSGRSFFGRVMWAIFFASIAAYGYKLNHSAGDSISIGSLGGGMEAFFAGVLASFVFGTLWFWLSLGLVLWYVVYATGKFWIRSATFVFIAAVALLSFANGINPIDWMLNNPLQAFLIAVVYVGVGVGWMLFKFSRFSTKVVELLDQTKSEFARIHKFDKSGPIPPEHIKVWNSQIQNYNKYSPEYEFLHDSRIDPRPKYHKSRIMFWMIYWPFSVTHDFLTDLYEMTYDAVAKKLDKIASVRLGDRIKDLDLEPPPNSDRY